MGWDKVMGTSGKSSQYEFLQTTTFAKWVKGSVGKPWRYKLVLKVMFRPSNVKGLK